MSSLLYSNISYSVSQLLSLFFIAREKLARLKLLNQFMLIFRVRPWGNFNDPFFLSSVVDYKIYLHPLQGDSIDFTYTWGNTNNVVTRDIIANSFSAMLYFCNYKHKLHLSGIITFGTGDSFQIVHAEFQVSY